MGDCGSKSKPTVSLKAGGFKGLWGVFLLLYRLGQFEESQRSWYRLQVWGEHTLVWPSTFWTIPQARGSSSGRITQSGFCFQLLIGTGEWGSQPSWKFTLCFTAQSWSCLSIYLPNGDCVWEACFFVEPSEPWGVQQPETSTGRYRGNGVRQWETSLGPFPDFGRLNRRRTPCWDVESAYKDFGSENLMRFSW